jgi:carbohydrate kinase (thermoresistant glucokinase family)
MDASTNQAPVILVMGVAGAGKSVVAGRLAAALGLDLVEADSFHPPRNVAKMSCGEPLSDADRSGWLQAIRARIDELLAQGRGAVVACSALKSAYRRILLAGLPNPRIVFLSGDFALLEQRIRARADHFMPASLLRSQFETLEPPVPGEQALLIDVTPPLEEITTEVLRQLTAGGVPTPPAESPRNP